MSKPILPFIHLLLYIGIGCSYYLEFTGEGFYFERPEDFDSMAVEDVLYWPIIAIPLNLVMLMCNSVLVALRKLNFKFYLGYLLIVFAMVMVDFILYQSLKAVVLG